MTDPRILIKNCSTGEERELAGITPVGREVVNGLKLVEQGASRRHATLSVVNGAAYVEDAGSRNGTFVNDRPVTTKCLLASGDRIRFDKEQFEVLIENSTPTIMTAGNAANAANAANKKMAGAWVEWNTDGKDGTERFSPEQLNEYLRKAKERRAQQTRTDIKVPCLIVSSGDRAGTTIPLTGVADEQEWTIGRSPECDIRFDAAGISEWHAKIVREKNRWKLIDAIATNGSFVNDLRIGMSYLSSGDNLRFGSIECVFHLPGSGHRSAAANRGEGPRGRTGGRRRIVLIIGISFVVTLTILYLVIHYGIFS